MRRRRGATTGSSPAPPRPRRRSSVQRPAEAHYERHPYPSGDARALTAARWLLPRPEWLWSLWRPAAPPPFAPRRILVAGCGAGSEAFAIQRRVPDGEVVAVDRSPRSIALARRLQSRDPALRRIRFLRADLGDPRLPAAVGRDFDFVSCHGVLSYVERPGPALERLRACMQDDAALYLGVNGEAHHSTRWRPVLARLGLDPGRWVESPPNRRVLALLDALAADTSTPELAARPATYLGGDLFGPPFLSRPLAWWVELAAAAGLHLRASPVNGHELRVACMRGLAPTLLPRTLAECHALQEVLAPSAFHRLLFTTRPPARPPWQVARELGRWRPVRLACHSFRLPPRRGGGDRLRRVLSTCRGTRLGIEWQAPEWLLDLLRRCDGRRTLAAIVSGLDVRPGARLLRDELYRLHLLMAIELLPPEPVSAT